MKILNIGLPRTGTYSLTVALKILGFKTVHYPHTLEMIDAFDAATEVRFPYEELESRFPGAMYIYTRRNQRSWLASCKNHKAYYRQGWNPFWQCESEWERIYEQKEESLSFFKSCPERLLVLDVCRGEGWEKLCPFLKISEPAELFPNTNKKIKGTGDVPML
jgi:hypothetical protein